MIGGAHLSVLLNDMQVFRPVLRGRGRRRIEVEIRCSESIILSITTLVAIVVVNLCRNSMLI